MFIFFLLIIFIYYLFIFEVRNFEIKKMNIKINNLPKSFENTKIILLSDFHTFSFGFKEKKVLSLIKDYSPDFIFITGDFVDKSSRNLKACETFWEKLGNKKETRVFGVLGNHDHRNKKIRKNIILTLLKKHGIHILNNETIKIFKEKDYMYLSGVDDVHTNNDNLKETLKDLNNNIPKILLSHSPDIANKLDKFKDKGLSLILAGHTHGGQVKIPLFRPYWVPTKNMGKYASGLFKIFRIPMYVNRGVGTSLFPVRFNCRPEVTVVSLRK